MSTATAVKERPILFSSSMVRAVLEGRKTQTRRVVKGPAPDIIDYPADYLPNEWAFWHDEHYPNGRVVRCPFGLPGEHLWVRESFDIVDDPAAHDPADGPYHPFVEFSGEKLYYDAGLITKRGPHGERWVVDYMADKNTRTMDIAGARRWKPSIHMPRWASRLTLEIVSVRIERLQDISEADAVAEGMHEFALPNGSVFGYDKGGTPGPMVRDNARAAFACLWDEINGEKNPWKGNPWVWVVAFKRVEA